MKNERQWGDIENNSENMEVRFFLKIKQQMNDGGH
jgi:hypothetical protein